MSKLKRNDAILLSLINSEDDYNKVVDKALLDGFGLYKETSYETLECWNSLAIISNYGETPRIMGNNNMAGCAVKTLKEWLEPNQEFKIGDVVYHHSKEYNILGINGDDIWIECVGDTTRRSLVVDPSEIYIKMGVDRLYHDLDDCGLSQDECRYTAIYLHSLGYRKGLK